MEKKTYIDWYCDECGDYMNFQDGFTTSRGRWTCTKCKCKNDVTDDNIILGIGIPETMFTEQKELKTDFELADFCRGGDLTED